MPLLPMPPHLIPDIKAPQPADEQAHHRGTGAKQAAGLAGSFAAGAAQLMPQEMRDPAVHHLIGQHMTVGQLADQLPEGYQASLLVTFESGAQHVMVYSADSGTLTTAFGQTHSAEALKDKSCVVTSANRVAGPDGRQSGNMVDAALGYVDQLMRPPTR